MVSRIRNMLILSVIVCNSSSPVTYLKNRNMSQVQGAKDFDASMRYSEPTKKVERQIKAKHPITRLCKELYIKNKLSKLQPQKDPIIPKIVHLIWVGPKAPPPIYQSCLESIKKHLPTWQCKIWNDKDIPALNLYNQQFYDEETNYGAKSDILRYEILNKFGGVYLDIDMVVFKPLDILNHTYEFYTGLNPSSLEDVLGNAIIASIPGHPILKQCIESIKNHRGRPDILSRTGPIHFEEAFFEVAKKTNFDRVIAFPASYFYPIDPLVHQQQPIKPETFAAHFFAQSWLPKKLSERHEKWNIPFPSKSKK